MKQEFVSVIRFATALFWLLPTSAFADDRACTDPYEQGQVLRKESRLLKAREQFRACVNSCSRDEKKIVALKTSCVDWLREVEQEIPTIVLVAKDDLGNALSDIQVTMDGAALAAKLDAKPLEIDPGQHTFVFAASDGTKQELSAAIIGSKKDQVVSVTFKRAVATGTPPAPSAVPSSSVPAPATTAAPSPAADTATLPAGGSSMRTVGYIAGGVGIVGLGLGGFFGLQAMSKNSDANCDSNSVCANPQSRRDAQSAATISTIGFVAGGLLTAGGIVLILTSPSETKAAARRWEAAPMIGYGSGGVVLQGRW